jgi:predicted GIY-YIG superfamily endonuclease
MNEKKYLYVLKYLTVNDKIVVKVGTTNNLKRRMYEHNNYYQKKAKNHRMPKGATVELVWAKQFSAENVEKYEEENKEYWRDLGFGDYVKNDRFVFDEMPPYVEIIIKKSYIISLNK